MPNAVLRCHPPDARRLVPAWLAPAWRPIRACTLRCALWAALVTGVPIAAVADPGAGDAANVAAGDHVGPYAASDFGITTGRAAGIQPAAAWYFADEYIATPRAGLPVTHFAPAMRAFDDVALAAQRAETGWPALVWNGSTRLLRDARLVVHRPGQRQRHEEVVQPGREHRDAANSLAAELVLEPALDPLEVSRESLPLVV